MPAMGMANPVAGVGMNAAAGGMGMGMGQPAMAPNPMAAVNPLAPNPVNLNVSMVGPNALNPMLAAAPVQNNYATWSASV